MEIRDSFLNGVFLLKPRLFEDPRGYFYEAYNEAALQKLVGQKISFIQDNQSYSSKGVLRGLHYQTGDFAQTKLVRVVRGAVYDVVVDLRSDSPSFKRWVAVELTAQNHLQLLIPAGFAHGFLTLEDDTVFQYKVDRGYSKSSERGVLWSDEELDIQWPAMEIALSDKDKCLPRLRDI